jgi:hypothetical protein
MTTIFVFMAILLLGGVIAVSMFFSEFCSETRRTMQVNEGVKRRTIRRVVQGSACVGLAFALMAFLLMVDNSEAQFPMLGKVAFAMAFGAGWGTFLLAAIMFKMLWFEKVSLPVLRERMAHNSQEQDKEN